MRRWILCSIVGGSLVGFAPLSASAEQYNLACSAGSEGDSHGGDNDDAVVAAAWAFSDAAGSENYEAGADLSQGGSLYAQASRGGNPAGTSSTRAAATFSETLIIDELPSGPIQVRAFFGVAASATAELVNPGLPNVWAKANASLRLNGFGAGECVTGTSASSATGVEENSSCTDPDDSAGGGSITLTVTPENIQDINEIYIDGNLEAKFEGQLGNLDTGGASASSSGTFPLARSPRGSEPIPGLVYIEIDPPTAHRYAGGMTVFPVPEPGAPLLAAVGAATLAAFRRRARSVAA